MAKAIPLILMLVIGPVKANNAPVFYEFDNMRITQEDKRCLAKNIYFEARNQHLRGQMAVAFVTLNRVIDDQWPNTICGVVYQANQFSWYSDGKSDNPTEHSVYTQIMLLVESLLAPDASTHDFTNGATHYHATYCYTRCKAWNTTLTRLTQIGTHIFYR